ncbi:MAG: S9 family peptidase [Acidobacteria bacterium]|nr:MAG: S9 family peptidase [Acidobacteriota bacterium]
MQFSKWVLASIFALSIGSSVHLTAQQKTSKKPVATAPATPVDEVVNTLFATRRFEQTAISPDGKKIAWVEALVGKDGAPNGNSRISTIIPADGKTVPIGAGRRIVHQPSQPLHDGGPWAEYLPHAEGSVAWAPDSQRIAFLSDAEKAGQLQLYISDLGGPAKKLTNVKGLLATPRWSPDGKTIAVLFTENATRAAGPLVAETPETGEIKDVFFEQRLALVDATSGEFRQISPADMYVYEYDWSPDDARFAVIAAHGNGDNNWYIAQLYTLDADVLGLMKSIHKPPLQIANPAWSPDGKKIAFIAGLMSDEPSVGGDIYTIAATGGEATNVTPEMKATANWLAWTPEGKIVFGESVEGDAAVATVDPASGRIDSLWRGQEQVSAGPWGTNVSLARDGKTSALIRSSFSDPPEIWAGLIGYWRQVTQRNTAVKPAWGDAKSLHWKNEGLDIQGWLIYPRNFDPAKKYPMIVQVHGGPGAAVQSSWPDAGDFAIALSGAGYFVFQPNPRGSFGQGEAFTRANVRDFGYGDFRDILAGVEEALRAAPIDPNRLGLTGWSYGGFMTMWGVTQTNRFKAAMAGAGIANYQSYYGQNKIDQWMIPFFGKSVYDDPEVYAKSSPITFTKNVKTPTLVIVGDSDGECPTPQSYEFWHALKTLGVETQLVVYEHEGHHFAKPADQRDRARRTVAWFDAHLR